LSSGVAFFNHLTIIVDIPFTSSFYFLDDTWNKKIEEKKPRHVTLTENNFYGPRTLTKNNYIVGLSNFGFSILLVSTVIANLGLRE
jgi:hypothetical protein